MTIAARQALLPRSPAHTPAPQRAQAQGSCGCPRGTQRPPSFLTFSISGASLSLLRRTAAAMASPLFSTAFLAYARLQPALACLAISVPLCDKASERALQAAARPAPTSNSSPSLFCYMGDAVGGAPMAVNTTALCVAFTNRSASPPSRIFSAAVPATVQGWVGAGSVAPLDLFVCPPSTAGAPPCNHPRFDVSTGTSGAPIPPIPCQCLTPCTPPPHTHTNAP